MTSLSAAQNPDPPNNPDKTSAALPPTERPPGDTVSDKPPRPPAHGPPNGGDDDTGDNDDAVPQGHTLGRYTLLSRLGQGGMGVVFRAFDTQLRREVALKTIKGGFAGNQEVSRFLIEARAGAKLDHPNITQIFDIDEDKGIHFFTMQLVTGGSLSARLKEFSAAEPAKSVTLVEKVARALQCAHEHHILHRDIKPANILLDANNEPLVADFGLAKFLDAETELTRAGKAMGTRPYMSPEQLGGLKEKISPATDIWALGVVLYELLTGKRPFASASEEELTRQIKTADPASPRKIRPILDKDLETIVLKCLQKEPADRYQSAAEVADELDRWRAGNPITARRLSMPTRLWRHARRNRAKLALVAVLLLAMPALLLSLNGNADQEEPIVDQAQAVKHIHDALLAGKPALLIGEKGGPKYFRLLADDKSATLVRNRNKTFEFSSADMDLLELLPSLPTLPMRFKAMVQHKEAHGNLDSRVGVYFGHSLQPTENGNLNVFLQLAFADNVRGKISVRSFLMREPRDMLHGRAVTRELEMESEEAGRPWRHLTVDIHADKFHAFWEQQEVDAPLKWEDANQITQADLKMLATLPVDARLYKGIHVNHQPAQALGLFIQSGTARFKNIILEPIVNP